MTEDRGRAKRWVRYTGYIYILVAVWWERSAVLEKVSMSCEQRKEARAFVFVVHLRPNCKTEKRKCHRKSAVVAKQALSLQQKGSANFTGMHQYGERNIRSCNCSTLPLHWQMKESGGHPKKGDCRPGINGKNSCCRTSWTAVCITYVKESTATSIK